MATFLVLFLVGAVLVGSAFFAGRYYGAEVEARGVAAALKLYSTALADIRGVSVAALARVKKYL